MEIITKRYYKSNLRDTSQNEQNTWCNIINFITSAMSRSTRPGLASLDTSGRRQILCISLSAYQLFTALFASKAQQKFGGSDGKRQAPWHCLCPCPTNLQTLPWWMFWGHDVVGPVVGPWFPISTMTHSLAHWDLIWPTIQTPQPLKGSLL